MATTAAEQLTLYNFFIKNVGSNNLSDATNGYLMLNFALNWLVGVLPRKLIPEIDIRTDVGKTIDANSEYAISGLTNTVYRQKGGIYSVRYTDGEYLHLLSQVELERFTNLRSGVEGNLFTKQNPKYFWNSLKIHVLPEITDASETLDFGYLKKPTRIASGVNCDFQEHIQDLICMMAAAFFYLADEKVVMEREMLALATTKAYDLGVEFPETDSFTFDIQNYFYQNAGLYLPAGGTGAHFV